MISFRVNKERHFRNSIGLRLLRCVFGCYLVVTVAVTCVQLFSEYKHVKEGIFNELNDLEETFKDSFAESVWNFDTSQLESTLSGMQKIDVVDGIKVTDNNQKVLATIGTALTEKSRLRVRSTENKFGIKSIQYIEGDKTRELFEYSFPIEYQRLEKEEPKLVGYGYIYADEKVVVDRVKYGFILIIVNSVIKTLALWIIFLYFMERLIAEPLYALTKATDALNPEKPETLFKHQSLFSIISAGHGDELYRLAVSFEHMRQAVLEKIDVIKRQNQALEQRVEERTQELADVNMELKHLALHDYLTGLPNRILFQDRLEHLLQSAARTKIEFAVASIDLRKFKEINDTFGHMVGDDLLKEVARRMSSVLRKSDTLSRMGGDEFAAIFPSGNEKNVKVIIEKLLYVLSQPMKIGSERMPILANFGVALYPEHGTEASVLFKNADMAMYEAKRADDGYRIFSKKMVTHASKQAELTRELELLAFENDQLKLHYQPIVDLANDNVVGAEALIRWKHPVHGLLQPLEFIPLIERSGTIDTMTYWVLQTAINQCSSWHKEGFPITITVNLSGRMLGEPNLLDKISSLLKEHDVAPHFLKLDISESILGSKFEQVSKTFDALCEMGVKLSIDDFGVGNSSFTLLAKLPFHELKVDRTYLAHPGEKNRVVVESAVHLSRTLNVKVVAEGVENEAVLTMLRDVKCDFAQGFYIAKPMELVDFNEWIKSKSVVSEPNEADTSDTNSLDGS